jgi:hypothetical protein
MKLDLSMLEARAPRARAQEAADMPVLAGCDLDAGKFALPDVEDVSFLGRGLLTREKRQFYSPEPALLASSAPLLSRDGAL